MLVLIADIKIRLRELLIVPDCHQVRERHSERARETEIDRRRGRERERERERQNESAKESR